MAEVYQRAIADGSPDWSSGTDTFDMGWIGTFDRLRFHRGEGFAITERPGHRGPRRSLGEVHDILLKRMAAVDYDTVFEVSSLKDGYGLLLRRHKTAMSPRELVEAKAIALLGTPYSGVGGTDCSWYTMVCAAVVGIELPHNAAQQHAMSLTIEIPREKIQPFDLIFWDNDHHVGWYKDNEFPPGRVFDTEPHSTGAPPGWPKSTTGTGVQIRPMTERWYTDWSSVSGICRLAKINGVP